ncbi:MAG: YfhO family protein [Ginsengibacter sp.]
MNRITFKILPHVIAVAIFAMVAIIYCKPALQGKVVQQQDTQGWRGMSQQSVEFHDKYGFYPLWTNSMFSGMPAYQIAFDTRTPIQVGYVVPVLTLGFPIPVNFFFLACLCFYILCIVGGVNPWISILGALAYSYSTYDPIIIAVGHNTKMMSIAYLPAVLAGLLLLFQKKYWTGFAVTALFSTLLIAQNHLQIVYYTLIIAAFFTIAFLVDAYGKKDIISAAKASLLGLAAGLLGLASNAVANLPTYEYAKESMRGGRSELTIGKDKNVRTEGGLDKDYAFTYSVAIPETFTLMIPGIYGGSNGGREYKSSSKFAEKLSEAGVPEDNALQMANQNSYWGEQPFTSGPVYLGCVICFLFIFGLVYLKGWHKWWLLAASIFGILLAWGSNFQAFNYFLFDHLPFYNKFRAPSMALVIPQFCFPFLAVLTLNKLVSEIDVTAAWKKLKLSVIITGVIMLLLCAFYFTSGFSASKDKNLKEQFRQSMLQQIPAGKEPPQELQQQADQFSRDLVAALHTDRKDLMGGDLLRTILLIAFAIVLTGLFLKKKINPKILIGGLIVLSTFDLLSVDLRYLNEDNFVEDSDFESAFNATEADQQIMKDPDHANFRVFNSSVDVFNDASTSFHHNSVGGYHPAKLGLYQDMIEHQLSKGNMRVFNMLNTKYFIVSNPSTGKPVAQLNPEAFGNAWLVKGIKYVNNADEEMLALDSTDLKDTAVIDKSFESIIKTQPQYDSTASIKLKQNLNDKIIYDYNSSMPQFAVFSEVYYNHGWSPYVDGKKSPYVKVNYILRGMSLPAGKHEIEFRFEPASFTTGRLITIWSNILIILVIAVSIFLYFKKKNKPDVHIL